MNDEAGRADFVSTICVVEVGGDTNGKTLSKLDMAGHKDFFEDRVKTEKDTLSEGVTEKDTGTGFGIKFVRRIQT